MTLHAVFEDGLELNAEFQSGEEMSADFGETTEIATEQYRFGYGLRYDPNTRTVSVDAADAVAAGDPRPVTSSAVQVQIGNIEVLLQTI